MDLDHREETVTPEQAQDRDSVWEAVARKCPEFLLCSGLADNYHAVREIVLGGSLSWASVHERFKPKPSTRVMDIGANTGIYSAYCGVHGARVTAYEPFSRAFSILSEMIERTSLRSLVAPVNAAIWTYTGECSYVGNVSLHDGVCTAYNGGLNVEGINWEVESQRAQPVACVSFDDAIGQHIWDCVKMDIEGAEFEVLLQTSEEALRRIRFLYVEFHPWVSQSLYERTIERISRIFNFTGAYMSPTGRWEAAYLMQK